MSLKFVKTEDCLAVDFSGNQIKILRGKSNDGKVAFSDVFSKKFSQASQLEINREVYDYFKKNRVRTRKVICAIPSKLFISKNVEIPSVEKEEIAKIIDLQAGRFTPYSRDEIVIDFLCMDTPNQHYTSVLLVIVNRALVDRYCRVFEDIGIQVKIAITSEAMAQVYRDVLADTANGQNALGGICMNEDTTDLTIADNRQIVFVRSLPVGAEHFQTDANLATAELVNELNKSLATYQDQGVGQPIKTLILTGMIRNPEGLRTEILKSSPTLQRYATDVVCKDYRNFFAIGDAAAKKMDSEKDVCYFDLMSVLSKASQTQVDLIPKEMKLKRRFRQASREMTSLGITIMAILIVFCFFLYSKIYFKSDRMQKITAIGKPSFEEARMLERVSTKNRVVHKILKSRGKGLSAFHDITGLLGESTYLSGLSYDVDGKITIGGTADSMSQVFALVNRLEASNHYSNVKTSETKTRREGDKDVADFEIECTLSEGGEVDKSAKLPWPLKETKGPE